MISIESGATDGHCKDLYEAFYCIFFNTAQQCLTFPRFEASVSQSTRDDTCGENPILAMSKRRSLETNDPTAKRKIVLRVKDPSLMIGLQLEAEFDFEAPSDSC